jgi:hypothetical protein
MPAGQDITETTINTLTLAAPRKTIIKERYIAVLGDYQRRACRYGRSFHWSRITVAVGSLLVPALLSIQYIPGTGSSGAAPGNATANAIVLYWVTWVISLLVTIANGVATLMKVDKKYYFLNTIVEQLRSEGWQYVSLTGRYAGIAGAEATRNHEYQFLYFCHMVEKIKMHQVEEEYFKLTDEYSKGGGGTQTSSGAASATTALRALTQGSLQPPTPQQPLDELLARLPSDLRIDIENLMGMRPSVTAGATGPAGQ